MKKLIAACLLALSAQISTAADSYLWWQFPGGDDLLAGQKRTWVEGTEPDFSSYRVGVMDNATGKNVDYLNIYNVNGGSDGTTVDALLAKDLGQAASAKLGIYAADGYSYYIELVSDANVFVGRSVDTISYSEAKALSYIQTSVLKSESATGVWQPTSFTTEQIPEPTSGLLVLLGLAGLALKRKVEAAPNRFS